MILGMKTKKKQPNDPSILTNMLEAGVHFGHQKSKWNPKMKPYVYTIRHNVHIIDLEKAQEMLEKAKKVTQAIVKKGGKILLVGTRKQLKKITREKAKEAGMPYINERWLGGTFSNFKTILKLKEKFLSYKEQIALPDFAKLSTREQIKIKQETARLEKKVGGIATLDKLPDAILILDLKENSLALKEAHEQGVKSIALIDTNNDPTLVDHPIPCNDDSIKAVSLILDEIIKSISHEAKSKTDK
jgi:small subunit ribosomal protein S2